MRVSFTGHRANKLGGYSWNTEKNIEIINLIRSSIITLLQNLKDDEKLEVITGGALGIDQMAFEVANELKEKGFNIETTLCVPFRKQYIKWNKEDIRRYKHHIGLADKIVYVDELKEYNPSRECIGDYKIWKFQKRNEYMVDHSDLVMAYWDGSEGGTKNCIKYAISSDVKVINILTGEIFDKVYSNM